MAMFSRGGQSVPMQQMLVSRYNSARFNLLLVAGFTAINLIMLISNTFTYFLFSASIPYAMVDLAMYLCGKYPSDYYGEELAEVEFFPSSLFIIAIAVAVVIIGLYVLCFLLAKRQRVGWLITALVLFTLDTVGMFLYYGISADIIVDIIFHVWVLVILAMGIAAHFKLKSLPETQYDPAVIVGQYAQDGQNADETVEAGEAASTLPDSVILRAADADVKAKVLLQTNLFAHEIVYRRVKKTNELVIDGNVYSEYEALVEKPHILTANVGGHAFAAGFDGTYSYITVDGQTAVQKIRVI